MSPEVQSGSAGTQDHTPVFITFRENSLYTSAFALELAEELASIGRTTAGTRTFAARTPPQRIREWFTANNIPLGTELLSDGTVRAALRKNEKGERVPIPGTPDTVHSLNLLCGNAAATVIAQVVGVSKLYKAEKVFIPAGDETSAASPENTQQQKLWTDLFRSMLSQQTPKTVFIVRDHIFDHAFDAEIDPKKKHGRAQEDKMVGFIMDCLRQAGYGSAIAEIAEMPELELDSAKDRLEDSWIVVDRHAIHKADENLLQKLGNIPCKILQHPIENLVPTAIDAGLLPLERNVWMDALRRQLSAVFNPEKKS